MCGGKKSGSFIILEEHKRKVFLPLYCWSLRPLLEYSVQLWSTQHRHVGASPEKDWSWSISLVKTQSCSVQPAEEKALRSFLPKHFRHSKYDFKKGCTSLSACYRILLCCPKHFYFKNQLLQNNLCSLFLMRLQTFKSIMSRNHLTQIGENYATACH